MVEGKSATYFPLLQVKHHFDPGWNAASYSAHAVESTKLSRFPNCHRSFISRFLLSIYPFVGIIFFNQASLSQCRVGRARYLRDLAMAK
jgi:hypothetical protein